MKKILAFFALLVLASCGVDYDGETRLIFESRVVDSQGNPVVGKGVQVVVDDEGNSDMISNGITDENGKILFAFPAPNNTAAFIHIYYSDNGSQYQDKMYFNVLRSDFHDYKFTLNDVVLYRNDELTQLYIIPNQVSPNTDLIDIRIDDNPAENMTYWNPLESDYFNTQTEFSVLKNSTVNLTYQVKDYSTSPATSTNYTVPIAIGDENVNYSLDY